MIRRFQAAGTAASADGAGVLLAAGGVVMALLADSGIDQAEDGTPVLNGIAALVKRSISQTKRSRGQTRTSDERSLYEQETEPCGPPEDDIDGYREAYGARVYPTVKPRRD